MSEELKWDFHIPGASFSWFSKEEKKVLSTYCNKMDLRDIGIKGNPCTTEGNKKL